MTRPICASMAKARRRNSWGVMGEVAVRLVHAIPRLCSGFKLGKIGAHIIRQPGRNGALLDGLVGGVEIIVINLVVRHQSGRTRTHGWAAAFAGAGLSLGGVLPGDKELFAGCSRRWTRGHRLAHPAPRCCPAYSPEDVQPARCWSRGAAGCSSYRRLRRADRCRGSAPGLDQVRLQEIARAASQVVDPVRLRTRLGVSLGILGS